MNVIGGYFELELCKGEHYHKDALKLNTARNGFEYVLRASHFRKVYVPYYTCEVMLEPIKKLGIDYTFYLINEALEPLELPELKEGDAFLYTNYFGLKQTCVKHLAEIYGKRLIVDNAQAFYAEPIQGINTFYSVRKFFGVPDGAYLYTNNLCHDDLERDYSYERMSHLLKRMDAGAEFGFTDFRNNDAALCNQEIKRMSKLTEALLLGIDHETVIQKRRKNFSFLDEFLKETNLIQLKMDEDSVPMVYPYYTKDLSLRKKLIENKVFVATYWPNVKEWAKEGMVEYEMAEQLIPIPIDQRYGSEEMQVVCDIVAK